MEKRVLRHQVLPWRDAGVLGEKVYGSREEMEFLTSTVRFRDTGTSASLIPVLQALGSLESLDSFLQSSVLSK